MPLRDIVQVFEAIPDRIEVSGHEPTWQVTGGSFDAVLSFVREAFGDPVVVARQDRGRWWPRVTLTVTKDPRLAATAPPLEALARPEPEPAADPEPDLAPEPAPDPEPALAPQPDSDPGREPVDGHPDQHPDHHPGEPPRAWLEDMFAYQEELRAAAARHRVPSQRRRR